MRSLFLIFQTGLRSIETNSNGFSFLGVNIQESSASIMTTRWNTYFVGFLETIAWMMFVVFFVLCLSSVFIDVTRNVLYHTYDVLRVNKIQRLHKIQKRNQLKVYHRNILDTTEETSILKHEMGKLQDDSARHLQLQTKVFEKNKNDIERKLASAALEKLRLNQKLKKLKKQQPNIILNNGGPLPTMPEISYLNNDEEIERCMRMYDQELKGRTDPAAKASKIRLQHRLQLRQHQLQKKKYDNDLNGTFKIEKMEI